MTVLKQEIRQGRLSLLIWTAALSFMITICILIYPQMAGQMEEMNSMFADMGSFSQAFGMDQINFGEFKGYFGIECGNTLGIGGAIFAALLGIAALTKEGKNHTAEVLLTHPISRTRIYGEKLLAVYCQIIVLNIVIAVFTVVAILLIGESLPWTETMLLFFTFTLLQLEIAGITYGLSSYVKGSGIGIAIGLTLGLYFMSLISNLLEKGQILKYITPFAYTDSGVIYAKGHPEWKYVLVGTLITIATLIAGKRKWRTKDIP